MASKKLGVGMIAALFAGIIALGVGGTFAQADGSDRSVVVDDPCVEEPGDNGEIEDPDPPMPVILPMSVTADSADEPVDEVDDAGDADDDCVDDETDVDEPGDEEGGEDEADDGDDEADVEAETETGAPAAPGAAAVVSAPNYTG